jgi:hypothetical protein
VINDEGEGDAIITNAFLALLRGNEEHTKGNQTNQLGEANSIPTDLIIASSSSGGVEVINVADGSHASEMF